MSEPKWDREGVKVKVGRKDKSGTQQGVLDCVGLLHGGKGDVLAQSLSRVRRMFTEGDSTGEGI